MVPAAWSDDLIARVRWETPASAGRIHLNNAGAAFMPAPVEQVLFDHLKLQSTLGGYEADIAAADAREACYGALARLINASHDEIAIVENASIGWLQIFHGLIAGGHLSAGGCVAVCEADYCANHVALLQARQRHGLGITVIPSDRQTGTLDLEALEQAMRTPGPQGPVQLVALTWIPTNGGTVHPARAVGRLAAAHGVPFLLDACQAVGQMPVDVVDLQCDFLSTTGRKFLRGPRASGFIYVKRAWLERGLEPALGDHTGLPWEAPARYGQRGDARRFELWERSLAAHLALGAAADYAISIGLEAIQHRAWSLAAALRAQLNTLDGVKTMDLGDAPCAIVSAAVEGCACADDAVRIRDALATDGVNISVSRPASTWLDSQRRQLPPMLRFSPHYYNTRDEIDRAVDALASHLKGAA